MRLVRVSMMLVVGALLACGEEISDPGVAAEQECQGEVNGAASGSLQACTLEAQRVGEETFYTFRFDVLWTSGDVTEGLIQFRSNEEPVQGNFNASAFRDMVGSLPVPSGEECTLSAGLEQDHGQAAVNIQSVPEPTDMGGGQSYTWFAGSTLATFTENPHDSNCPGALELNATFGPAK